MSKELQIKNELFSDIKSLIDSAKQKVATEVNSTMSALYWDIGNRINQDLLKKERTEYGKQTVIHLQSSFNMNMELIAFQKKIFVA